METVSEINEVVATEETVAENPVVETQETEVATTDNEVKSLGKDLAEMAVVGIIIYGFCKLMDFVIDKIKAGVKKFKEKRAAKKAQATQQSAPAQSAPVAQVAAAPEATEEKKA